MPREAHASRRWEEAENGLYRLTERNIDTLSPTDGGEGPVSLSDLDKDMLYELAQERDIEGRSKMSKDELVRALEAEGVSP